MCNYYSFDFHILYPFSIFLSDLYLPENNRVHTTSSLTHFKMMEPHIVKYLSHDAKEISLCKCFIYFSRKSPEIFNHRNFEFYVFMVFLLESTINMRILFINMLIEFEMFFSRI